MNLQDFLSHGPNFKSKYLDEEYEPLACWYEFGCHTNGNVDIASPRGDIFTNVPPELAAELITLRRKFVADSIETLRRFCSDPTT